MWIAIANGIGTRQGVGGGVGPTPPPYTPPLDTYPADAGYSVRKLSSTYTGDCMRVRRFVPPYDEQDIGFTPAGDLDEAAIVAFGGSDELRVSEWYDQSGQSRHAFQIKPNTQPRIYNGTNVIKENGKPAVDFISATYTALKTGGNTTNSSTISFYSVFQVAASAWQAISGISTSSTVRNEFKISSSQSYNVTGTGTLYGPYITIGQQNLGYAKLDSSSVELALNGNTATTDTNTSVQAVTNAPIAIGGRAHSGGESFTGTIQEVIYWFGTPQSRTDIESNINTFYSIY